MVTSEADMIPVLERWLQRQGMQTNIEVPWVGVYARGRQKRQGAKWDLVAWNDSGRFLAIEVESRYQIVGAEQAAAMMPACEECYLAVPWVTARQLQGFKREYEFYGLGLIVTEPTCRVVIPARQIIEVNQAMRDEMLRLAKTMPRNEARPGGRKVYTPGWRFSKLDICAARRIGLAYASRPFPRSSLQKRVK